MREEEELAIEKISNYFPTYLLNARRTMRNEPVAAVHQIIHLQEQRIQDNESVDLLVMMISTTSRSTVSLLSLSLSLTLASAKGMIMSV